MARQGSSVVIFVVLLFGAIMIPLILGAVLVLVNIYTRTPSLFTQNAPTFNIELASMTQLSPSKYMAFMNAEQTDAKVIHIFRKNSGENTTNLQAVIGMNSFIFHHTILLII